MKLSVIHFVMLILLYQIMTIKLNDNTQHQPQQANYQPSNFEKLVHKMPTYPGDKALQLDHHQYAQQSLPFMVGSQTRRSYGNGSPIFNSRPKSPNTRYDLEQNRQNGVYKVVDVNKVAPVVNVAHIHQSQAIPAFCATHNTTMLVMPPPPVKVMKPVRRVEVQVLIPQAVPYGVRVPVPFPVRVEVPRYKDIEVTKNVYVKIPIYEHIPIYHHFAISRDVKVPHSKIVHRPLQTEEDCNEPPKPRMETEEDCEELNKQLDNFMKRKNLRLSR